MKKILLLDIENITQTEQDLLQALKNYHSVYVVYAKSPVTFGLDALNTFSPYIHSKKLTLIKVPQGTNAADFGLAFLAGQLSIQSEVKNTTFDVMSNDKDLKSIVNLLVLMGFQAKQLKRPVLQAIKKVVEVPSGLEIQQKPHLKRIKDYCDCLIKMKQNKPKKLEGLGNSVRAILKLELDKQINDFISLLIKQKVVSQKDGLIFYDEKTINAWAGITVDQSSIELANNKKENEIFQKSLTDQPLYFYLISSSTQYILLPDRAC